MIKRVILAFTVGLAAISSSAQQTKSNVKAQEDAAWARAGCGPDPIHFDVTMDKHQHPLAQPDSGNAVVYVFEVDLTRQGLPTTRVGVDGKWVGGNVAGALGDSYLFFSIAPGNHRLCSNWQGHPQLGAAVDFTAEDGKSYFFRARISPSDGFTLAQVPEAEGNFLIASHGLSNSREKEANGD